MIVNSFLHRLTPLMEDDGAGGAGGNGDARQQQAPSGQQQAQATGIDYDKIQKMLEGTLSAKEDTALKAYFRQQGLSQEEMSQAIATYKEQKAKNTPDITAIQKQAEQAQVEREALLMTAEVGLDIKTMPYVIKMADLNGVVTDGNIDAEKLKSALLQVLEDIPQLKPQEENQKNGFRQIGVGAQQSPPPENPQQQKAVPVKRWNRWNS